MTGRVYDSAGQRWKQPRLYKYSTARAAWELTGQASYPGLQVESMFEPYLGAGTVWQRPMETAAIMPQSSFSSVLANWMWTYALTPYSTATGTPSGASGDKTLFTTSQRAVYVTDSTDPRCRYQLLDSVTATGVPAAEIDAILKTVPWPSGFNPVNGNISLYDMGTGTMREYTGVTAVTNNPGHWTATGAGFSVAKPFFEDLPSTNYPTQLRHGIGTTTLMHPTFGYVGISEIRAGKINHALAFMMSNATANRPASWPAAATDGRFPSETWSGWNGNYPGDSPRLGQWGRLPLTVNPQYNPRTGAAYKPLTQILIKAAQEYGLVAVGITLGAHTFIGESGAREQAIWGTDPWAASGELAQIIKPSSPSTAFRCDDFPWDLTEWAPIDWQRPDPDLGRLRPGETKIEAPYADNIALSTTSARQGVGTITITGQMFKFTGASRTGTGTITAVGVAAPTANVPSQPLVGVGTITAAGTITAGRTVTLTGTGQVDTTTKYGRNITGSLAGTGTLSIAGSVNTGSQMAMRLAWPNGGGQAATATSPFSADRVAYGTDTGGVRISNNGITDSYAHFLGMNEMRSRQTDGVAWSRTDAGTLFATCGDGTSGNGGLYVCQGGNTRNPTRWVRLDGVAAGSSALIFDGGNSNVTGAPPGPYPRHYGGNILLDEYSIAGYTLVHVATVTNGAWRIKVRNSDLVAVEQVQYAGTAGAYVRCIQMPVFAPDNAGNDYSRIIISLYHSSTPLQPVLCTNANDSTASPTLSTSTITNAPTNVEAMGYAKASGGQPVTIFAGLNYVYFSANAFTTTAGAVTLTNVSRTNAQADGPENDQRWISVGTTVQGANHVILVGTFGGRQVGSDYNTVWRGVVAASSTTPWSAVTWTALRGATYFSEQVMNTAGADYVNWITGQNTPGRDGTAAVSGFSTSADGARMYLVSRGAAYRSDDYGLHWYATRQWGSADHTTVTWDKWTNKDYIVTCTGDWAWAAYHDAFVTEPHIILAYDPANGNGAWFDPKTGECFIGGSLGGSTSVPAADNTNTVWGLLPQYIPNSYSTLASSPIVDYNLNTGQGPDTLVGGVMDGCCIYGNAGAGTVRAIVVACKGAKGMWYTKDNGTTWLQVTRDASSGTVDPFMTSNGSWERAVMVQDNTRGRIYVIERQTGTVWRMSVATDGTVSQATRIFVKTWTYAASRDSAGYISLDETNDRLWISTLNAVWYINTASTVPAGSAQGNATASGFATNYPGELAGPLIFSPAYNAVMVATLGLTSAGSMVYNPTLNGADGPRFLVISNATTSASWNTTNAVDWSVSYDRVHRLTYQAPNSISSNWDGSKIAMTMQGMGVGVWRAG